VLGGDKPAVGRDPRQLGLAELGELHGGKLVAQAEQPLGCWLVGSFLGGRMCAGEQPRQAGGDVPESGCLVRLPQVCHVTGQSLHRWCLDGWAATVEQGDPAVVQTSVPKGRYGLVTAVRCPVHQRRFRHRSRSDTSSASATVSITEKWSRAWHHPMTRPGPTTGAGGEAASNRAGSRPVACAHGATGPLSALRWAAAARRLRTTNPRRMGTVVHSDPHGDPQTGDHLRDGCQYTARDPHTSV
jgi:hypothetical protein